MTHHRPAPGKSACSNSEEAGGGSGRPPAGLLLAAGAGRRLGGRPKALLPYRDGLLVEHAARVLREGGCDPVYVVLGAAADEVRARAAGLGGCELVDNPDWASGMGSSLRAGLTALSRLDPAPGATVVALVDQPGIGPRAVARLLSGGAGPSRLAAAAYRGRRGHPVLFGAAHWAGVAASAAGDHGARGYLTEHQEELALVECADIASPADIDTPADLRLLTEAGNGAVPPDTNR